MIKTKKESDSLIKKKNLNRMFEGVFSKENINELPAFLETNKYPYYNMRDKLDPAGRFAYKITAEEVLADSKSYKLFSVFESLALADERLILQGEIQVDSDFNVLGSLSSVKGISNRKAMQYPEYHLMFDLKEKREPSIRGLNKVLDYIIAHELIDMVVEFSLFEIPIGINKENIIIWELRNY